MVQWIRELGEHAALPVRVMRANLSRHGWRITALWLVGLLFFTMFFGSVMEFSFMLPFAVDAEFVAALVSFAAFYVTQHAAGDLRGWCRTTLVRPCRWVRGRHLRRRGGRRPSVRVLRHPSSPTNDDRPHPLAFA